jgi:mono/diheme cytochrome c family protein
MKAVTPGNPGGSKLYNVIKITSGEEKMPPSGSSQLTKAEIDSIGKWISYGALNENCGEICDTINPVTFSGTIWPVIQTSCTGCHSGTAPSGNISLTSYNNVAAVASGGLLLKSLNGTGVTRMPPAGFFSACRIRQFEIWIKNGFLNN